MGEAPLLISALGSDAAQQAALDLVADAKQGVLDARASLLIAVHIARRAGATWDVIGDHLGISRQAAWGRYAKAVGA